MVIRRKTYRGEEQSRENLFPCIIAATASPTPPGIERHRGLNHHWRNLAPSTKMDGEHSLCLARLVSDLYAPAHRFPGPPPSTAPNRPPERDELSGIGAGHSACLLFALKNCSKGKGRDVNMYVYHAYVYRQVLIALTILPYKEDFGYPIEFQGSAGLIMGMDYHPNRLFETVSGFKFRFRVRVHRDSTQTESTQPSLLLLLLLLSILLLASSCGPP